MEHMAGRTGHANDGSSSSELDGVDLTTPLGHETLRSSIDVWELDSESGFVYPFRVRCACLWVFYVYLYRVAMPMGYKLVISHALRMHGIYCPQPSGRFAPSGFGAINAIVYPSHPWYNYEYIFNLKKQKVGNYYGISIKQYNYTSVTWTNTRHSLEVMWAGRVIAKITFSTASFLDFLLHNRW